MAKRYTVTGTRKVLGNDPGSTFEADIPEEQEKRLIASGSLVPAEGADTGLEALSREELDALAETAGVENPQNLPNKAAVADAIDAANTTPAQSGSDD